MVNILKWSRETKCFLSTILIVLGLVLVVVSLVMLYIMMFNPPFNPTPDILIWIAVGCLILGIIAIFIGILWRKYCM